MASPRPSRAPTRRHLASFRSAADARGFTLIELLAFAALFVLVLAVGLPHIDTRRHDINLALRQVAADVRWARSRAVGSGAHFALRVTAENRYQVERLEFVTGSWQLAEVVRTTTLPDAIRFVDFTPDAVEFNTRGTVVFPALATPAPWMPRLVDATFGTERAFAIWPSGQFHELP
jgi:hypothetical protein